MLTHLLAKLDDPSVEVAWFVEYETVEIADYRDFIGWFTRLGVSQNFRFTIRPKRPTITRPSQPQAGRC